MAACYIVNESLVNLHLFDRERERKNCTSFSAIEEKLNRTSNVGFGSFVVPIANSSVDSCSFRNNRRYRNNSDDYFIVITGLWLYMVELL